MVYPGLQQTVLYYPNQFGLIIASVSKKFKISRNLILDFQKTKLIETDRQSDKFFDTI